MDNKIIYRYDFEIPDEKNEYVLHVVDRTLTPGFVEWYGRYNNKKFNDYMDIRMKNHSSILRDRIKSNPRTKCMNIDNVIYLISDDKNTYLGLDLFMKFVRDLKVMCKMQKITSIHMPIITVGNIVEDRISTESILTEAFQDFKDLKFFIYEFPQAKEEKEPVESSVRIKTETLLTEKFQNLKI